ncbi:unnamed protein product [Rhodiola kirilowii]
MVTEIVEDLKAIEKDTEARVCFGGLGSKLKGDFKVVEDKKHRANTNFQNVRCDIKAMSSIPLVWMAPELYSTVTLRQGVSGLFFGNC